MVLPKKKGGQKMRAPHHAFASDFALAGAGADRNNLSPITSGRSANKI